MVVDRLWGKLFSTYEGNHGFQTAMESFFTPKKVMLAVILLFFMLSTVSSVEAEDLSNETKTCLNCHQRYTPGLVGDWESSRHSSTTPAEAFQKDRIERRISADYLSSIPSEYRNNAVGCYECHSQNTENHNDSFTHFGYRINVVVSPNDCSTCHPAEREQYSKTVKAHAYGNLKKNPIYRTLYETITTVYSANGTELEAEYSSSNAQNNTCFACHGTKLIVDGTKEIERAAVEAQVPDIKGWPNQGVGRVNPDGSKGSCTACHPRHSFKIEIARKPYTCSQCHLKPDVPAYNVYKESKHGNIFFSQHSHWNFTSVPWTLGEDFKTPTCSVCHNALIVDEKGNKVAERTHDFGSRIWVRIFGIYSHPHPVNGATYKIVNEDGQNLPTTLTGKPAFEYLISADEQEERKQKMKKICTQCHGTSWVENQFAEMEKTNARTDKMVLEATKLLTTGWDKGAAEGLPSNSNPFDEHLERLWVEHWLFYANSIRKGEAMFGPDYTTFYLGWHELTGNLHEMSEFVEIKSETSDKTNSEEANQMIPGFGALLAVTGSAAAIYLMRKKG